MKKADIEALAREADKTIETEKDLSDFSQMLKKVTLETALNAELDDHLGYDRHQSSDNPNYRNGYSSKTLITEDGQFEVDIPRDRDGSLEPHIVKKHQTRLTAMDNKTHCLYAKGMTTREIVASFKEMFDADVSSTLISRVTNAMIEQVTVFPQTRIQHCIVHMVRNSIRYVTWKYYKPVTTDLKRIYQSVTEDEAMLALDQFSERWDEK